MELQVKILPLHTQYIMKSLLCGGGGAFDLSPIYW